MCRSSASLRRDFRQIWAIMKRYWWVKRARGCSGTLQIWITPLMTLFLFVLVSLIYENNELYLEATQQYQVTSSSPDSNVFVDSTSGFETPFELRNCTLYQRFGIGLVKQDVAEGNENGFPVLENIYADLQSAYKAANQDTDSSLALKPVTFDTNDDLQDYVNSRDYRKDPLCFAIGWKEYNMDQKKFALNLRFNFGEILSPRLPQTEYEESSQNQIYLSQYSHTGFLQTMTSATSRLIEQVRGGASDHTIEMMYMPMNYDQGFFNNGYGEVLGVLFPFTVLAFVQTTGRALTTLSSSNESRVQQLLYRAGMRKTVEFGVEYSGILTFLPTFLPILSLIAVTYMTPYVSWGFMFLNTVVFALSSIFTTHLIRFAIDSHKWAEGVELFVEVTSIVVSLQGYFLTKIYPQYVYTASFFVPLSAMTWCCKLGIIASNKKQHIELFGDNVVVNGNDMSVVLRIASLSLLVKILFMMYAFPFKIANDPKKPFGPFYWLEGRFWKSFCCRPLPEGGHPDADDQEAESLNDHLLHEELQADGQSGVLSKLTPAENEMHADGTYETPCESLSSRQKLQLNNLSVEHDGHHIVNGVSLTVFAEEVMVLIGENGCGKSALMSTIAGMTHVHGGEAVGFGYDMIDAARFITTNFLFFSAQEEVLIDQLTPEQHLIFMGIFLGLPELDEKVSNVLWEFDLQECANIMAYKMSKIQRKRLSLALAFLGDTKIVLLDEPTQGMDIASKRLIWQIIQKNKANRVIVVATQDMDEARELGDRIGLLQHGALKLCGSSQFFGRRFNHCIELVFTMRSKPRRTARNSIHLGPLHQQLTSFVKGLLLEAYRDRIELNWNSLSQLVVRLPAEITRKTVGECIDINQVHEKQGTLYESLVIGTSSLADTFERIAKSAGKHQGSSGGSDDHQSSEPTDPIDQPVGQSIGVSQMSFLSQDPLRVSEQLQVQQIQEEEVSFEIPFQPDMKKVSFFASFVALLRAEFAFKALWKEVLFVFGVCSLLIGQESIFILFFEYLSLDPFTYNEIGELFEENGLPILTFANTETASGSSTDWLMTSYLANVNEVGKEESVLLGQIEYSPESSDSVYAVMTEAAFLLQEEAELAEEEGYPPSGDEGLSKLNSSEGEGKETFGGFYIYEADQSSHTYSIGVFGNQVAAATCPAYGATMLETIAQTITGEAELSLEFINDSLPINTFLYPIVRPAVAEVYGVSVLAAVTFVMAFQLNKFGKPMTSGFYTAFHTQGGSKLAYFLAKYLKAFMHNVILCITISMFLGVQGFRIQGLWVIMLQWSLVNPLLVLYMVSVFPVAFGMSHVYALDSAQRFSYIIGAFCLVIAGTIALDNENKHTIYGFLLYWLYFSPAVLVSAVQYGFLFQLDLVLQNQDETQVNFDIFNGNSFYQQLAIYLCYSFAIYLLLNWVLLRSGTFCACCCGRKVRALNKQEVKNYATDVNAEEKAVLEVLADPELRDSDYIAVVDRVQCFKWLRKFDVRGSIANDQVMVVGSNGYGLFNVQGVSFTVKRNERFVILGSSSSGTSAILTTLLGQFRPVCGKAWVNGHCNGSRNFYQNKLHGVVGYQPQADSIDENLSVEQHLRLFGRLANISLEKLDSEVKALLKACQLWQDRATKAGSLSQGLLRRLTLAMALIGRPQLVLLDNPISGIDPHNKLKLIKTIEEYTEGRALVMSTRDVQTTEQLGHKVAIQNHGKFVAIGSISDIIKNHGKGYNLEVALDTDKITKQVESYEYGDHSVTLEGVEEAKDFLTELQTNIFQDDLLLACDFDEEFTGQGLFEHLYKEFEDNNFSMPREKLAQKVLTTNIVLGLIDLMQVSFPEVLVSITGYHQEIVSFSIVPREGNIDVRLFMQEVDDMTESLPVIYSSLSKCNLDKVFQRLVQTSRFDAEKINQKLIIRRQTLADQALNERFTRRFTINQGV